MSSLKLLVFIGAVSFAVSAIFSSFLSGILKVSSFFIIFLICFFAICIFFLPSLIAFSRDHQSRTAIFVLNLFLGGTGLFWIIALVWALSAKR